MAATFFFLEEVNGTVSGITSTGEPDGKEYGVELIEDRGDVILRVRLEDSQSDVNLMFTKEQAVQFADAMAAVVRRCGLD